MRIDDLTRLPDDHPPSPFNFPVPLKRDDTWGHGVLPEKLPILMIGWLGDFLPDEGDVHPECIDQLWQAFNDKKIIIDGTAGWHDCELCDGKQDWYPDDQVGPVVEWQGMELRVRGYGHFLIKSRRVIYMAPVLILHYILDHRYKPPQEFVEAVRAGNILGMGDLKWEEYGSSI